MLFWRINAVKADISCTFIFSRYNGVGIPSGISTTTLSVTQTTNGEFLYSVGYDDDYEEVFASSETDLLKVSLSAGNGPNAIGGAALTGISVSVSPSSPPGSPSGSLNWSFRVASNWLYDSGLIYPRVYVSMSISAVGVGSANAALSSILPTVGTNQELITCPITIFGKDANLYGVRSNVGILPTLPQYDSISIELEIEIHEFWPYKNSAGDAVFDTTTGAQIAPIS